VRHFLSFSGQALRLLRRRGQALQVSTDTCAARSNVDPTLVKNFFRVWSSRFQIGIVQSCVISNRVLCSRSARIFNAFRGSSCLISSSISLSGCLLYFFDASTVGDRHPYAAVIRSFSVEVVAVSWLVHSSKAVVNAVGSMIHSIQYGRLVENFPGSTWDMKKGESAQSSSSRLVPHRQPTTAQCLPSGATNIITSSSKKGECSRAGIQKSLSSVQNKMS